MPDAAGVQASLLLGLLELIVTTLAERLQVSLAPEQLRITTVRLDVVTHEQLAIALDQPALPAGVEIAQEDTETKQPPTGDLVPGFPGRLRHLQKERPDHTAGSDRALATRHEVREETPKEGSGNAQARYRTPYACKSPARWPGLFHVKRFSERRFAR